MSLRVWLPLNGTLDNQGLDNITTTLSGGIAIDNSGKIGKCYNFDGTEGQLLLTNLDLRGLPQASFAFWCCPVKDLTGLFQISVGGTHRVQIGTSTISFRDSNNSTLRNVSYNTTFTPNTWVHMVCIYNRGQITIYVNGIQTNHNTTYYHDNSVFYSDLNQYRIGRIRVSSGNVYYNGKLNDFRIYDHVLSPMEVKQISQGLILHYPLNNNGWGNENLHKNSDTITSTWIINQGTVSNGIATLTPSSGSNRRIYQMPANGGWSWESNKTYTASIDARSPDGATLIIYPYGASSMHKSYTVTSSWKRYSFTFTATKSDTGSMTYHVNQTSGVTLQLKHPKLELGQKATPWCPNEADELYNKLGLNDNVEYDTSGYGNNGTKTGTFSWTSDTPKYQVSSVFDSSSIIDTPVIITSTGLISQYTAAAWIKRNNTDTTNNHCFFTGPIELFIQGSTSHIRFYWSHATSTSSMANNTWDPSVTINNSIWTHIVVTFADGVLKCYINGELSKTSDRSSTGQYIYGNKNHTIGSYHNTTEKFIGQICDVRAYATALSAQDVLSLYNNSAYIDNQGNIYGAVYEEE